MTSYIEVRNVQRALSALHRRDKTGHLHVSWDEIVYAREALETLQRSIEAAGNQEERSARGAEARDLQRFKAFEDEFWGDDGEKRVVVEDIGLPSDGDLDKFADAVKSGDPIAKQALDQVKSAAASGDERAADVVKSLEARGVEPVEAATEETENP